MMCNYDNGMKNEFAIFASQTGASNISVMLCLWELNKSTSGTKENNPRYDTPCLL